MFSQGLIIRGINIFNVTVTYLKMERSRWCIVTDAKIYITRAICRYLMLFLTQGTSRTGLQSVSSLNLFYVNSSKIGWFVVTVSWWFDLVPPRIWYPRVPNHLWNGTPGVPYHHLWLPRHGDLVLLQIWYSLGHERFDSVKLESVDQSSWTADNGENSWWNCEQFYVTI